jgi:cytochrome c-type biogenesis protein
VLATVLGVAGSGGLALYGAFLMLIYSAGLSIPFIALSIFRGYLLERFKRMDKYMNTIRIIGGVLIVIMGIILMTNNLSWVSSWFTKAPSIS